MFWVWDIHYSVFFFLISWNVVNNFLTNILLVIYKDNSDQTDQLTNRTLNHWKINCCCSVPQSCLNLCDPMDCRHSCPSPSPGVCSDSCPLSQWCHPTISSSVIPFSSCLQTFPALGSFLMCWLFSSGGQSIGVSALATVLSMNS